ncbi:MAG: TIM barrel protein [Thiolinea sp.]
MVGANLDPSHLFWMGADPLIAAEALGEAVQHVHAKDTPECAGAGDHFIVGKWQLDGHSGTQLVVHHTRFRMVKNGGGSSATVWKMGGYDGWLSIEHEDVLLNSLEGLEKSVDLAEKVMPVAASDSPQAI